MQTENSGDQGKNRSKGLTDVSAGLFFFSYRRLIQKQIFMAISGLHSSCNVFLIENNKHRAVTAQRMSCSFTQVEKCVRSVRCGKGACRCLSEAEGCQSFAEQPTRQNTCLKLMPIDHHEWGKIAGHAGMDPPWGKQTITGQQHSWDVWVKVCIQLLQQHSCCDIGAMFSSSAARIRAGQYKEAVSLLWLWDEILSYWVLLNPDMA